MSVDDHGLEVLKKSAKEITPGDKSEYSVRVAVLEMPAVSVDIPPVTIDTTGLATDAKQDEQTALLEDIKSNQTNGTQHVIVDDMPPVTVDTTGLATSAKQDDQTTLLGSLETLITAANVLLTGIKTATEAVDGHVDQLEGYTDGIEGLLTSIRDNTDGLEGFTDGIETLLTAIGANTDGLEGFVDGIEGLLTDIKGFVDGLETLATATNTKLDTVISDLGTINTSIGSTNTKLDDVNTKLAAIQTAVEAVQVAVESLDSKALPDTRYASADLTGATTEVTLDVTGMGNVSAHIGTDVAQGFPIDFQVEGSVSIDGVHYETIFACNLLTLDGQLPNLFDVAGFYSWNVSGFSSFKLSGNGVGSVKVAMRAQKGVGLINQIQALTYVGQGSAWSTSSVVTTAPGVPIEVQTV
jgi:uncharacterized protein YoxC